ncbi:hypothetical protein BDW67DRAFT_83142 [Aspergillus spinulosporus]
MITLYSRQSPSIPRFVVSFSSVCLCTLHYFYTYNYWSYNWTRLSYFDGVRSCDSLITLLSYSSFTLILSTILHLYFTSIFSIIHHRHSGSFSGVRAVICLILWEEHVCSLFTAAIRRHILFLFLASGLSRPAVYLGRASIVH